MPETFLFPNVIVPLPSVSTALPDSLVEQEEIDEDDELSVELAVELVVLSSFEHDETKNEMLHNKKNRHVNFFIVSLKKFVRCLRWANLIIDKLKSQQLTKI